MKPAAKLSLQLALLGMLVFAGTIVAGQRGWLAACPDPLMLPDGGMKELFRSEDAGVVDEDAGVHDVVPWMENGDAGILIQDSEVHTR